MIVGIDLGNYATKDSNSNTFLSKCSKVPNLLGSKAITTDEGTFYIGEGQYDTEYRKVSKKHIRTMFLYALANIPTNDMSFKVTVGLPLSQLKDKDNLKELLLKTKINQVQLNNSHKKIIIDDVYVYPEGVAAIYDIEYEGIVIDIGGKTTDVFMVIYENGIRKVKNPISIPLGTINLYSNFINCLNQEYVIDLLAEDAERIIKNGLKIDGKPMNCDKAAVVFKEYINDLFNTLQVEYNTRTNDILCIGGGSELLQKTLLDKSPNIKRMENSVFANARGFKKAGEQYWRIN